MAISLPLALLISGKEGAGPCSGMVDLLNVADGAYRVFALWALESLCFIAWLFRLNAGKLHLRTALGTGWPNN